MLQCAPADSRVSVAGALAGTSQLPKPTQRSGYTTKADVQPKRQVIVTACLTYTIAHPNTVVVLHGSGWRQAMVRHKLPGTAAARLQQSGTTLHGHAHQGLFVQNRCEGRILPKATPRACTNVPCHSLAIVQFPLHRLYTRMARSCHSTTCTHAWHAVPTS